jgi:hypothetical protein
MQTSRCLGGQCCADLRKSEIQHLTQPKERKMQLKRKTAVSFIRGTLVAISVAIGVSPVYANAITEGHFSMHNSILPLPDFSLPTEMPPSGPTFEPASQFPPCYFCKAGPSPDENPANDLPTYREMNPDTDQVPPTEAVPELGE